MSQFYEAFFEDARERLSETEKMLLNIRLPKVETETMNAIFRSVHSIKGSAATFGFEQATELAHEFENILDWLRNNESENYRLTPDHIDILLSVNDEIIQNLNEYQTGIKPNPEHTQDTISHLKSSFHHVMQAQTDQMFEKASSLGNQSAKTKHHFQIELLNNSDRDMTSLIEELTRFGKVIKRNDLVGKAFIDLYSEDSINTIQSICLFVVNLKDLVLSEFPTQESTRQLTKALGRQSSPPALPKTIRVPIEKIDALNTLIYELLVTQKKLAQSITKTHVKEDNTQENVITELLISLRQLHSIVRSIRMISIEYVFSRYPRMVRDLATRLNKKASLTTQGSSIEIDQILFEGLIDPLTHLIRNCLDHGIESPEKRASCGKQESGRLNLSASYSDDVLQIQVSDDGAGLNREHILEKARNQGLIFTDDLSDTQVWDVIFEPGFSTAQAVTDISGRGVGMDIVKRNVNELGGTIQIQSKQGVGTTFNISIPMPSINTLANKNHSYPENQISLPVFNDIQHTPEITEGEIL